MTDQREHRDADVPYCRPARKRPRRAFPAAVSVLLLCLTALRVFGDTPDTADPAAAAKKKFSLHVLVLPIVYYTPETRLAFGVGGVINFRLGKAKEQTRPSSLWLLLVYTQNKQFELSIRPELIMPKNRFVVNFSLIYERFPRDFYGIGNGVTSSNLEKYTPRQAGFEVVLNKQVLPHFYLGMGYHLDRTTMEHVVPGGQLAQGTISGSQGGTVSGLGIHACWDTRDNIIYPRQGIMFSLIGYVYTSFLGSTFDYTMLALDFRTYTAVAKTHVFAFQAYFKTVGGDVPFYDLSLLGGANAMRGYYGGFYRDRTLTTCQAEYRLPVWWRFGVVAFAGLGEVSSGLGDFRLQNLKYSIGTGLRFKFDTREGTNIRLDWAWGEGQHGFYLTVQEAF